MLDKPSSASKYFVTSAYRNITAAIASGVMLIDRFFGVCATCEPVQQKIVFSSHAVKGASFARAELPRVRRRRQLSPLVATSPRHITSTAPVFCTSATAPISLAISRPTTTFEAFLLPLSVIGADYRAPTPIHSPTPSKRRKKTVACRPQPSSSFPCSFPVHT